MLRVWITAIIFILSLAPLAHATGDLKIEKIAEPATIESGGTVKILLNISNPFDSDIIVKMRDINSIGGTTIDTQCIQGKIPASAVGISEYESIQVHNPGTFTLGTLEVKYTNPKTGKEVIATGKNKVDVTVTGGNPNIAFSSTSTKLDCQFDEEEEQQQQQEEQKSEEEQKREEMQKKMEELKQQQDEMQKKLSESRQRMNQDMNSVKQQQQQEAKEANEKLDKELSDRLSENKDFQDMKKQLEDAGYQEKSNTRSALRDNETEFKYEYEKPGGEKGEITGKMKDGKIEDLKKFSDDDQKDLEKKLSENKDFREAEERLQKEGFTPDKKEFSGLNSKNETDFNYQYKRPDGETANITGNIKKGDASDIGVKTSLDEKKVMDALSNNSEFRKLNDELLSKGFEKQDFELKSFQKNESSFSAMYSDGNETMNITGNVKMVEEELKVSDIKLEDGRTLFDKLKIPLLLILILLGIYSYLRYLKRDITDNDRIEAPTIIKPINAQKEAMKLIRKAEKMYHSGKKREAYTTVSAGVRLYFKYVICSEKEELTTSEIIKYAKGKENNDYVNDLRECFTLCDLVKFAKYRPNDKDFGKVIALAKACVK
ncbi:MAG: hypothetical protein KAH93_00825 [Candidatus Aenigmarchaeota archaeon]|nr:hypothetical protein [Candidatus Aenigmarchaeota archaeon]